MNFDSRCFWHPKDTLKPNEYEDAYQVGESGIAAIADGVSSGMFSRTWADLLTRKAVLTPPTLENLTGWLVDLRSEWAASIDPSTLDWARKQKLQQSGGGYSTLLWVQLSEEPGTDELPRRLCYRGHAVGDSCLLVVRQGAVVSKFPLATAADFDADPHAIGSVNRRRDADLSFSETAGEIYEGDLLVLATDALARWWYQQLEAEQPIDWEWFWQMTPEQWCDFITGLRALPLAERIRTDDTTLVMLRMSEPESTAVPAEELAANAAEADAVSQAFDVDQPAISAEAPTAPPEADLGVSTVPESEPAPTLQETTPLQTDSSAASAVQSRSRNSAPLLPIASEPAASPSTLLAGFRRLFRLT